MTIIKLSIKKRKHKKKRRSSAELHEVLPILKLFKDKKPEKVLPTLKLFKDKKPEKVLPTLKLVEDKKPEKKEIKTISEQSQDELEPINSPMSDE